VRRIGVLMPGAVYKPLVSAFIPALAGSGWTDGRNVRMDFRWTGDDINRIPVLAAELVGLQPDIILTGGTSGHASSSVIRSIQPSQSWYRLPSA
jgi:putative ABC transport system substrate-binding protein